MSEANLSDLKKLMLFSGRIPETHIEAMKHYAFIFFNGTLNAKIDYDFAQTKNLNSTVTYDLAIEGEIDNLDYRCKSLETAIKTCFWKEVKVKVSINGKECYASE